MSAVTQITTIFESIYLVVFWGWPFILLAWIFILKFRWKAWPVDVVIIEKRGENLIKTNDRAGKYVDGFTGMTGYRLMESKDTIPIVNYEWVMHNVVAHTTIFDRLVNLIRPTIGTMFFFRYGSKQYKPININQTGLAQKFVEIKSKDGKSIYNSIYQQFDPRKVLGALNFEVVDWDNMNFMVQEQRASFERRKKKGEFLKQVIIPLGAMVIAALVCIMMIKFSYDWAIGMRGMGNNAAPPTDDGSSIPGIGDLIPGK